MAVELIEVMDDIEKTQARRSTLARAGNSLLFKRVTLMVAIGAGIAGGIWGGVKLASDELDAIAQRRVAEVTGPGSDYAQAMVDMQLGLDEVKSAREDVSEARNTATDVKAMACQIIAYTHPSCAELTPESTVPADATTSTTSTLPLGPELPMEGEVAAPVENER